MPEFLLSSKIPIKTNCVAGLVEIFLRPLYPIIQLKNLHRTAKRWCLVFARLFLQQVGDANSKKDMQKPSITTKHWSFLFWQGFKGQLISKGLFGILYSPKKRTKKFDFNTMIPQVDLFSFVFWEKLKTPRRHFEINWPLVTVHFILIY